MRISKVAAIPFCAGFAVMVVVAGSSLTSVPLDWDEGATLSAATRSTEDLLRLADYMDAVIAPYYFLLLPMIKLFGQSDVVLRMPSLLAMAAGAGVTAELGRRLAGQAAGIVAGLLCAAIPGLVLYAQTARPYGIAFFFTTLASLLLLIAVRTPTWWRWAAYGACVLAAGVFHLVALSVLAGHLTILAFAWWRDRDRRLWRAVPALGVALAALSPLAWLGRSQHHLQLSWVPRPGWQAVAALPGDIAHSAPVGFLLLGLALAAYAALPRRRYAELLALFVMPVIFIVGVSQISPVWVPRYGIFLLAPLAVLAAALTTSNEARAAAFPVGVRAAAILAAITLLALPEQIAVRTTHTAPDTRAMAAAIHEHAVAGDVIVYTDFAWTMRPTLTHYLDEMDWSDRVQPPDILVKRSAATNAALWAVEFDDIQGRLGQARRIWLIGPAANVFAAPVNPLNAPGWKIKYIGQRYEIKQEYVFQTGRAVLLILREQPVSPL